MSLDDFRTEGLFDELEDEPEDAFPLDAVAPEAEAPRLRRSRRQSSFLGMTPPQRAVLAVMLFVEVCAVGMFLLIATGRMVPPGLY